MNFKSVLFGLLFFALGLAAGIGGLAWRDYNTISAQQVAATVTTVAQRAASPTAKATATLLPTETSQATETPSPENPGADTMTDATATPTLDASQVVTTTPKVGTPSIPTAVLTRTVVAVRNTPTPRATATVSGTVTASGPKGDSPFTAKEVAGTWDKIPGNSFVWYKIGSGATVFQGNVALDANVDTNEKNKISFLVFSPEQASDLNVATNPKGRGAPNNLLPTHALIWIGGSWNPGIWYLLVKNDNPVTVDYRLMANADTKDHKNCRHYPETMANGVFIIWSACD